MQRNVPLRSHSTMRLGGHAAFATEIRDCCELQEAVDWAQSRNLPTVMIGQGSNIIWRDEGYPGLVLINKIRHYRLLHDDGANVFLSAGAGEVLDDVVSRTVNDSLTGIEALSLIPGTVGAVPVQNVGAYGQEVSQTLFSVEAYDKNLRELVSIPGSECSFGYRTSRFKTPDQGRFFITAVTFHLRRQHPKPPFYSALSKYFEEHSIQTYTPRAIREAVIEIRSHKLPDPAKIANSGSFFANPIIGIDLFTHLRSLHPDIPHWPAAQTSQVKIAAAWLMEQAGLRDVHDEATGMATWHSQPLVLVNERATSTSQLLAFKMKIVDAVHKRFNITLVQEPDLFPLH